MGEGLRNFLKDNYGILVLGASCSLMVLAFSVIITGLNDRKEAQSHYCARQGMTLVKGYCLTPEETITRRAPTTDDSKEAGQ